MTHLRCRSSGSDSELTLQHLMGPSFGRDLLIGGSRWNPLTPRKPDHPTSKLRVRPNADTGLANSPTVNMKLIIAGASGLVATEVLRQSLRHKDIKAVVALARKSVAAPPGTSESDATKLRSVVVSDYETYPDDAKKEFVGADACIW